MNSETTYVTFTMERLLDCDGDNFASQEGAEPGKPIRPWPPSSFAINFGPLPAKKQNLFSLHFPNFRDYFVKKVVYEIRNVINFRGTSSHRNSDYMSSV